MNKVRQLLKESLTGGLYQMTLSGATGEATGCSKKKIRPVLLKDRLLFQITAYRGTQVFHENHTAEETAAILEADLSGSFKQLQIETTSFEATVLVSKKGKMTVRKSSAAFRKITLRFRCPTTERNAIFWKKDVRFPFWWIWECRPKKEK